MAWTTLTDSVSGTFVVTTRTSTYLINLDLRAVVTIRGDDPVTAATIMDRDRELVDLIGISECTVGRSMVLVVDLHKPGVSATRRVTSPVTRIQAVAVLE
ncbi:MAG: hypothetical protein JWQ39_2164 [Glaciihabitans sp.]|nr:hypothetical protein [Glaciihabitans sp.]